MKIRRYLILIIILVLMIGIIPLPAANAQDDVQPLDDEFVSALVMMAVNHDMMAGNDEMNNLVGLRDWVSDYFDQRIANPQNNDEARTSLNQQKSQLTIKLNEEIRIKRGYDMLKIFLSTYTWGDDGEGSPRYVDTSPKQVVSATKPPAVDDEYDPSTDYFNVMHSRIMTDFPTFIDMCLDVATIQMHPSLAPVVTDSSDWSYYVPQISDSSADFWGQPGDNDDSMSSSSGSNGSPDTIDIHKPVRFINNGFEAVTVVVESYEPAPGLNPAVSSASTVVFPESNSSAYLDLPQGTYTFCYYWQLDTDYNNDDYFDYHHRSTSPVTLNENSSSIPESAVTVSLNPDSVVSNPNGKCGEGYTNAGNGNLTPAEAANAGTHTYVFTCEGHEWCEGEWELFTFNISFGEASFTLTGEGENSYFVRVGENQYTWTGSDGEVYTLTFTMDGFRYYNDPLGATLYYTLADTSSVSPSPDDQISSGRSNTGLTPEETANEGTHTYLRWCDNSSKDSDYVTYIMTFTDSSFSLETDYGDIQSYSSTGDNQYYRTDNVGSYTATFTSDGWSLYFHNYSNYCYFKLQD